MPDYTVLSACELSDLYRTKTASPVTVVEQILKKIEQLNPSLNAFCFTDSETSLQQALESALRWKNDSPLSAIDGIPIAVKDLLSIKNWPTRKGSLAVHIDQPWNEESPAVTQLRNSGMVFVGKTTTSEFGSSCTADSMLYGQTYNPWNTSYTPGGSSSGSAVATASAMVPCALGTDFMGSVILPASFCGVAGFKPSYGMFARSDNAFFECSHVGSFARTIDDLMLLSNISSDNLDISKLRVAYCFDLGFHKNIDNEILSVLENVAIGLADAGANITKVQHIIDDPENILSDMFLFEMHQQFNKLSELQKQTTSAQFQQWALLGSQITPQSLSKLQVQQLYYKKQMQLFMNSYDVILCASTTITADAFDSIEKYNDIFLSHLFNLTHQPCVTVPVGLNSNNLPIAVLVAGAQHADAMVLEVARKIEFKFPMPACPIIP